MAYTNEMKKIIEDRIGNVWRDSLNALKLKDLEFGVDKYKFARDGSLLSARNDNPLEQKLLEFGLIRTRGSRTLSRGPIFFESLDPYLQSKAIVNGYISRLDLLVTDFLADASKEQTFVTVYALLDYLSFISLQILNSAFSLRREGHDINAIKELQLSQSCLSIKYEYLTREAKYDIPLILRTINSLRNYIIENLDILSAREKKHFKVPECAHPLRMLATCSSIYHENQHVSAIIGLPTGGTEVAILCQGLYSYHGYNPELVFVTNATFHSNLPEKAMKVRREKELSELQKYIGKQVIIIDDNTATGKTLKSVAYPLKDMGVVVSAYAVEADVVRMRSEELPDGDMLKHVSGKLSVIRKVHPQGYYRAGSNSINEVGREILSDAYNQKAQHVSGNEKIFWHLRANLAIFPTSRMLRKSQERTDSQITFKNTFLSNFYPAKVRYDGINFPSVEHAYQYAKLQIYFSAQNSFDVKKKIEAEALLSILKQSPNQLSPGDCKKQVKQIVENYVFSADWKVMLMTNLLLQKFSDPYLKSLLISTQQGLLIELNDWGDSFWGVEENKDGLNLLGRLLMLIRDNQFT